MASDRLSGSCVVIEIKLEDGLSTLQKPVATSSGDEDRQL